MKLLYIFLLSFVVGSRRLSGYYNRSCSICIINLPPVNSQGSILQYFSPVSLTYGFFIGFDEILKESLCSVSSNQSVHSQIQHPALDLTTTLVNFRSSVINARTSFLVGSGRVMSCREFLPILTCTGEHMLTSSTISGKSNFIRGSQVT